MKERLPFTLDMDTLESEASRASMSVVELKESLECEATEICLDASNYKHPLSVVRELLVLIRDQLEVTNVWLISCKTTELTQATTRICVVVAPRNKEQSNAS